MRDRRPEVTALLLFAVFAAAIVAAAPAFAQAGPFGVGAPELGAAPGSNGFFLWIANEQSRFYRALTAGLRAMKADPNGGWWMVALSFAYGVFHAAGPGHGKAVITSWVLADGQTLRRGIVLAFVSAFVQGLVAIVLTGGAITLLHLTAVEMTDATTALERTSAAAILGLGLWLVWSKIVAPLLASRRAARALPAVASEDGVVDVAIGGASAAPVDPCGCGVVHVPDPARLEGAFSWRRAIGAVAAVGIRPCTGALIVLVFAFAQGMAGAGVLSVLAMALGTGFTVSLLATFAVGARGIALRLAGDEGPWPMRVMRTAEIAGALIVLAAGILLVGAALAGAPSAG